MAKLLKHFGLGYGNGKKSDTFDFRAKTLPASKADRDSVCVVGDTSKSSGRRNTSARSNTVDCGDSTGRSATLSSHTSRRASNETFLTIPARGLRSRNERNWHFKGIKNRDPSPSFGKPRDSELTGSNKACSSDTKDLRRSMTADDISNRTESSVTPAVRVS